MSFIKTATFGALAASGISFVRSTNTPTGETPLQLDTITQVGRSSLPKEERHPPLGQREAREEQTTGAPYTFPVLALGTAGVTILTTFYLCSRCNHSQNQNENDQERACQAPGSQSSGALRAATKTLPKVVTLDFALEDGSEVAGIGGMRIAEGKLEGAHHRRRKSRYDSRDWEGMVNSELKTVVPMMFTQDSIFEEKDIRDFIQGLTYDVEFLEGPEGQRSYKVTENVKRPDGTTRLKETVNNLDGIENFDRFKSAYEKYKETPN